MTLSGIKQKIMGNVQNILHWKGQLDTWNIMAPLCCHGGDGVCRYNYLSRPKSYPECTFKNCPYMKKGGIMSKPFD